MSLIAALLIVYAQYGRALGFSFLFDDTFDLARVEGRSYWDLLSSSEGYSYYRPIPFLIWKVLRDLQASYDQSTLHALPLLAHAIAGWCLFLLIRRLGAGLWAAYPAVLFLTFPFHYQSVAIVGTLFHPLAGAAILGSLVAYERARHHEELAAVVHSDETIETKLTGVRRIVACGQQRRFLSVVWHLVALMLTLLALWAHESGVVVLGMIVLVEIVVSWRASGRIPSWWVATHLAATLLFVVTWSMVEKAPFTDETSLSELQPKSLFYLQGFTWPLSAQTYWMQDHLDIPGGITITTLGLLDIGVLAIVTVVAAYGVSAWRIRRWELLAVPAFAIAVSIAAGAPSLWRLSWEYVENSPRLLYLVAIGASIFWGLIPALRFRHDRLTLVWRVVTTTMLLLIVIQSWRFVDVRMEMWVRATTFVDDLVSTGETYEGRRILVMNAPSWFAQGSYEYPYGHLGVQVIPSYIGVDRVIYTSSGRSAVVDAASGAANVDTSSGPYNFGPHGSEMTTEDIDALLRDGYELIDVTPVGDEYAIRDVGRLTPGGADPALDLAGAIGGFAGVDDARVTVKDGWLTIYIDWHMLDDLPSRPRTNATLTLIEVRNSAGSVVYAYAGDPLAGFLPVTFWQAGDLVSDSIAIRLPETDTYSVHVGLQRVFAAGPMPATGQDGTEYPDGMLPIGVFEITDSRTIEVRSGQ